MLGIPDDIETDTYTAVGRALSEWETVEIALADLYSLFVGRPTELATIEAFCDHARIFALRLTSLEEVAEPFFRRFCSQPNEGEFDQLIAACKLAAADRNRVAHGLVQRVHVRQVIESRETIVSGYMLCAPHYSMKRLGLTRQDGWGSAELAQLTDTFTALRRQASALLNTLLSELPSPRTPVQLF